MTSATGGSRGFWPLRDLPVVVWLVAAIVVALTHPLVPAPRWLLIHLLLLGAASHAILVWSHHFADALLHTAPRPNDRRVQSARLLLLDGGAVLVLSGVVSGVWPVTVAGASCVAVAVVWHGAGLAAQLRRALPGRFRSTVHYYVAAACLLPAGALLGTLLARGVELDGRLVLAHVVVNVLGWMGLTVVGTLVTLWPTMLRTRIADAAEWTARRALPVLVLAVVVAAAGSLLGWRPVAVLGLAGYLTGLSMVGHVLVATARSRPPSAFPTWSVAAGLLWLTGCLATTAVMVGTAGSGTEAADRFGLVTPLLAAGFGAQVLLGALSYLVPVVLGGGAVPVRAANAVLDRAGAFRIVLVNAGLLVCALPVPRTVRVGCSVLVLAGLAWFVPLLLLALRAARIARRAGVPNRTAGHDAPRPGRVTGAAVAGLAAVLLVSAAGVAVDPGALRIATAATPADVTATGRTTTAQVRVEGMRFHPDVLAVPAGDRLVVELTNGGDQPHDLVLANGTRTDRIDPGKRAELDAGVIAADLDGWCSMVGHRQMGMVLKVHVTGGSATGHAAHHATASVGPSAASAVDPGAKPGPGFHPFDAALPPAADERTHRITLPVTDVVREVAPGVTQTLWTYGGTAPGPTLRGRVGDVFEVTLVNHGSMGHSIDFHAGAQAPGGPMRTIAPGQSLTYRFTATRSGVWLYHCSTMPMSLHIANGMFGAVLIDPPDLAPVDREYLLVQSEFHLGPQGGVADPDRVAAGVPDLVVFNGYAWQYDGAPLTARVGQRLRIWVLAAGPNRGTSFHVVGGQFDTVYREGAYDLRAGPGETGGSQALGLTPGQGGFAELTFPEAGDYPFVTHAMSDAERGAHGLVRVSP